MLPLDTSWHNTRAVADLQERPNREEKKPRQQPLWKSASPEHYKSRLRRKPHHAEVDRHERQEVPCDDRLRQKIPSWVVLGARWWRSTTLQPGGQSTHLEGDTWTVGSPGRELNLILQGLGQRLWPLSLCWCYGLIHQRCRKQPCPCLSQQAMFAERYRHSTAL